MQQKGNEHVLALGTGFGAGSRYPAKILRKGNGCLTCCEILDYTGYVYGADFRFIDGILPPELRGNSGKEAAKVFRRLAE